MRNKPRITPTANSDPPLLRHAWAAPSVFTPESLIEAVRVVRNIRPDPVPEVCILEFDGDLTDWLVENGRTERYPAWACFHTTMEAVDVDGENVGLIARTIGGPYTVLVAEQLAACGAKVILGLTSAGRVSETLPIPSLVIVSSALRDEGTSYHYLPSAETVEGDADLAQALRESLSSLDLPVVTGRVWTTDAPYRETAEQLDSHARNGIQAVEMQAASLFAFGAARNVRCGVVAHVSNGFNHAPDDQFDKGSHHLGFEILKNLGRAGLRSLRNR